MRLLTAGLVMAITLALGACGGSSLGGLSLINEDQQSPQTVAAIAPPPPPVPRDPSRGKSLSAMVAQTGAPPPKSSFSFFSGFASQLTVASLTKPGLYAPASVRSDMSPTAAYSAIALAVKRCWLAYAKPRLPNHNFDGEASLNDGGQAKIAIYERVEGQKLGRFAFRVEINASGSGSTIESVNVRLSEEDSERLRADIARWADGGEGCSA